MEEEEGGGGNRVKREGESLLATLEYSDQHKKERGLNSRSRMGHDLYHGRLSRGQA